jgi:hypothetical protein
MKKKILSGLALLVIAVVAAWNVNLGTNSYDWSTVSLANMEALAEETVIVNVPCEPQTGETCIIIINASGTLSRAHLPEHKPV